MVDRVRPEPEEPGLPVEQAPEHARGIERRNAEPVDRAVGRDERGRVAVRQERVVRDRRERRRSRRALRAGLLLCLGGAHDAIHGPCQRPEPATSAFACVGAPRSGRVRVHRRRRVEQRLHHAPLLLDRVLAREAEALADQRRVEQHLVGRRALAALGGELHVELDRAGAVRAMRLDDEPDAGRRVELDDELVRLGVVERREAQLRRALEDEPELRLRHGQALAGADEERHARPAPVLDLQPQRGVGLGGRVGRDAVDRAVAVVLPADVVRRVGLLDRAEERDLRVLDRLHVAARGRLHRGQGHDLHQVVDDDVAQRADRVVEVPAVLDAEVLRHRDLDGRDVLAAPDRLEDRVREPQVDDLLGAHLPQVVVDPEELRLVDVGVELVGERTCRREVVAERLLDDHPGGLRQPGLREPLHDPAEQERRDLEVEDRQARARRWLRRRGRRSPRRRSLRPRTRGARQSAGTPPRRAARRCPRSTRAHARRAARPTSRRPPRRRSGNRAGRAAPAGTANGRSSPSPGRP